MAETLRSGVRRAELAMSPPLLFLSYSRRDLDDISAIARVLKIHGIRTWQDLTSLGTGLSEASVRKAIRTKSSGLLFYSTEESVSSEFIRKVELPEAERAHKDDPTFNIVPIFRLSINDTDAALSGILTVPISNFNGAKVEPRDGPRAVVLAAHQAAEKVLQQLRLEESTVSLGLTSKQTAPSAVALDLDFAPFFQDGLPSAEEWNGDFPMALSRVKAMLLRNSVTRLRLYSFAHLSLGLLFGFIFRSTTGFHLEIEQRSGGQDRSIWTTSEDPAPHELLMTEFPGTLGSRNLCVKINLFARDDSSVATYASAVGLDYRALLEVSPTEFPYSISKGQGAAIARQLAEKIKELHAKFGTNSVHLFAAVPLGLALLIGHNLNACGSVQCYEFDNASREYHAACVLR